MSDSWQTQYETASRLARHGDLPAARRAYTALRSPLVDVNRLALVTSDLGTLDALEGNRDSARRHFLTALHLDRTCRAAIDNLTLLDNGNERHEDRSPARRKVAIVSFLFNWPSTGGGIVHTVELAAFLERAGYDVRLFGVRYEPWNIGQVDAGCPFPVEVIPFEPGEWSLEGIREKLRAAVDRFAPDSVIVTDAWNVKPHLVEALHGYRVFLRMQAQECLCPLNNLRLLPQPGGLVQCPDEQLSNPDACRRCLIANAGTSGDLHRLERELSGVDDPGYHVRLLKSLQDAEAVLVLNPRIAETLRPFCRRVEVVTWGMDPQRFPAPVGEDARFENNDRLKRIFFAGVTAEYIKGFHVLREACARLWRKRQDFLLVVSDRLPADRAPFLWPVGWKSQAELPRWYRGTDVTVVPTVVQEGLSRTSVEAMACARPVVAARIGGLPFTVADGETGLLFEPGDAGDLAAKLETLLDDAELRQCLGRAGRTTFEERFLWPDVIRRQYRPLLEPRDSQCTQPQKQAPSSITKPGGPADWKENGRGLLTVIGRGHSGTRAIAHTLRASGVDMGARLNPSGSGDLVPADDLYAACRIMARHVRYVGSLEWEFSRLHSMAIDGEFVRLVERYLESVLASRVPHRGWKLPETTLVYPWIVRLFPEAKYIHWVRDPRDVILYPHKTDDLRDFGIEYDEGDGSESYRRAVSWKYQWDIVQATPPPRHFVRVRFEDFVLQQDVQRQRLEMFLGFPLVKWPVDGEPVGRWKVQRSLPDFAFLEEGLQALDYAERPAEVLR